MVLTIYTCEGCGEPVANWSDDRGSRPASEVCPECGGHAASKDVGSRGLNASSGQKRSWIAGCGVGQEAQGNRELAEAGINARYDPSNGDLVADSRKDFLRAIKHRGLHSNTDGGFTH